QSTQIATADLAIRPSPPTATPLSYVQHAHARSMNGDANAAAAGSSYEGAALALRDTEADGEVLAALAQFPSVLATAADDRQPHKVARYREERAATHHKGCNQERGERMRLRDADSRGECHGRHAFGCGKTPYPAA
ncbi:DALR anticodon-binding domain-containing protein, partial [Bifidobacterium longum]|uniref:DALR anticodon-binding domain-containing protein n=1 Tax=Bifidobacterium longum TaxID=216816 RepID=UPI00201C0039